MTLDEDLIKKARKSRNGHSFSERLNQLAKRGLKAEEDDAFDRECQAYFSLPETDDERSLREWHKAANKSLKRDDY